MTTEQKRYHVKTELDSECDPPKETRVTFSLWYVLAFIVALFAGVSTLLYANQQDVKKDQTEIVQRVTRLEANYGAIIEKLDRAILANEKLLDKLDAHLLQGPKGDRGEKGKDFWGK